MHFFKALLPLCLVGVLAACGGGGGSAGATSSSGTTGTSTVATTASPTLSVSDVVLSTDKLTISNDGLDKIGVTVTALDEKRNVVADAGVTLSVNQNSIFSGPPGTVTSADGTYKGVLTIGTDKSDREIAITATINNVVKRSTIRVVGSKLTISASPVNPSPSQTGVVTVSLLDAAGTGMPGLPVSIVTNMPGFASATAITNLSGIATRSFVTPSSAAIYTIRASGAGVLAPDYQLRVFSSTIPTAVIPAGAIPSLSSSPNVLPVNSPGATSNQSTLKFTFLDANTTPVQNVRVRFENRTTGLPLIGSSISTGTQTVYTDPSGTARAQFISGQNTSATNGVSVRACYSASDFTSLTDCPNSVNVFLTIAGQALAVSIGDDNKLLSTGAGTYIKRFAVTVADSAGKPISNAPVDISVDLTHYGKSRFWGGSPLLPLGLTESNETEVTRTINGGSLTFAFYWCANEDTNRNGIVDAGENIDGSLDTNGQATLEPRKSDLLISYDSPTVTTTDSNGILVIKVEYSQRFGRWLNYRIRGTTSVLGSQGQAERSFVTDVLEGDVINGSFLTPPYGVQPCNTAG
jgi:hypothetical protein